MCFELLVHLMNMDSQSNAFIECRVSIHNALF